MKNYFLDVIALIKNTISDHEQFTAAFSAENLDFSRFTQGKIRQAGTINQHYLKIQLIRDQKHAASSIGLSGHKSSDKERIEEELKKLREQIAHSQPDPFLMLNEGNHSTHQVANNELTDKAEVVESILKNSAGLDLVGIYYGGPIYKGFASSFGQINWFEKSSFIIDTSVYHSGDKAIKQSYADTQFHEERFVEKMKNARIGLTLFDKEAKTIAKGSYRAYFAPSAVYEILSMMNWGGFSRKSLEVKTSPLWSLQSQQKSLSPDFSLRENIASGVGPNFQSQGFLKPDQLSIIEQGQLKHTLISPKTAKEYGLDHNGADDAESLCCMDMAAGQLLDKDILSALGDGLYINNLWYLNYSDRQNGCLTGMTRFLCYVVQNGAAVAPFSVMRFDDSIYRLFGENLLQVTKNRELIIDTSTYDERSTKCALLPGIIAENVRFTL